MAKRKSGLSFWLTIVSIACGVASICMMFLKSIKLTTVEKITGLKTSSEYTGLQAVIGYTENKVSALKFSFLNLLPYILLVIAIIISVLALFGMTKGKIVKFVVCGLFIVSGVLFFCESQFIVLGDLFKNELTGLLKTVELQRSLGLGAIIAGSCSLVGGVSMLISAFKD